MSRRFPLACIVILSTGLCTYAQIPFSRNLLPTRTSLARVGLERHWYGAVPLGVNGEHVLQMNLVRDLLLVQTDLANFHAFDAESGRYLWGVNLGRPTMDARPPAVNSQQVFVTNSQTLFALDRRTGRTVWTALLEALPSSATAADENQVMVGLRSGKLVAYNTRDRTAEKPPGRSAGTFAWAWQSNRAITARPISAERVIAFASQDNRVYVAVKDPSDLLFRFLTGGPIVGSMGILGTRTLIVPSGDNVLYAVDLFNARTIWQVPMGAPLKQEPLVGGGLAFVLNAEGVLAAVDTTSGELKWSLPTRGGSLLSLGATRVYLLSHDRELAVVDRATGKLLVSPRASLERSALDLREYQLAFTNDQNDRLYLATRSGMLVCLREMGQLTPRLLRDPEELPFGYLPPEGEAETLTPPANPATPVEKVPPDAADKPVPDAKPADDPNGGDKPK